MILTPSSVVSTALRNGLINLIVFITLAASTFASEASKYAFNIGAETAEVALKKFSDQSGLQVIAPTEFVLGVRTQAVKGDFTPSRALDKMLSQTGLVARFDEAVGAFAILRSPAKEATPSKKNNATPDESRSAGRSAAVERTQDETITLSVFEVSATKDNSYGSTTSNSITGTRKELRSMPVSADVMNRTLIDDLGAVELRELLEFAPGVGAFLIAGGTSDVQGNQPGDRIGAAAGSLRGLAVNVSRNGLVSNASSFDNFSKDRVEIIRGPQSLLYGPTNASGVIVINTKRPRFTGDSGTATVRLDSEGSKRAELELNVARRLGSSGQKLALLVDAFKDHQQFWRVNNRIGSEGRYLAAAWSLTPHYTLRADYEKSHRQSVDPLTVRLSAANDPVYGSRHNLPLRLLIYQNRASDILGGTLNYPNADSFTTDMVGETRESHIYTAQFEGTVTSWLSVQLQAGETKDDRGRYNNSAANSIVAPGRGGNPTGEWAIQLRPNFGWGWDREKVWRGLAHVKLPAWRFMKHELSLGAETRFVGNRQGVEQYYLLDAAGNYVRDPNQLNNSNSGRTLMPNVWWPLSKGLGGPPDYQIPPERELELGSVRYRRDYSRNTFSQFVTEDNPWGYSNGSSGVLLQRRDNRAAFGTLGSEWFGGKVDTIVGYRYDYVSSELLPRPFENREFRHSTHMLGMNWHVLHWLTLYYARSTSFQPSAGFTPTNALIPSGLGRGDEIGLKFGLLDNRVTGTVSFYRSEAKNNSANLPTDVLAIIDPSSGVNGPRTGGMQFVFDRETKGVEMSLTSAPVRGLRLQASFSHIDATEGADVVAPIFYNDQFHVNAAGQVTLGDGRPLLVPQNPATPNWNPASPTPGVSTEILTVAMLRNGDASGNYRASLDPNNGRITNASALHLDTPTVGTGMTQLPIEQHQLGFVPPSGSSFIVRKGGDRTTGYARNSLSFTANYHFDQGKMRGLSFGGNYRAQLGQLSYYYTDLGNPAAPVRRIFIAPDQHQVMFFIGYNIRIGRRTLKTQVNVANALNEVNAIVYPNVGNGSPEIMRLANPPRVWSWTNSVRF